MSDEPGNAGPVRPLLRVTDLVAGYASPVVGPVSFEIRSGETLGLWGSNGSGKSTLLQAIAAGARVFAGKIERADGLTLAYQEQRPARPPTMPVTGWDLLGCAGVPPERPPPGMPGEVLGRRVDRLSGGQFQSLCVWAVLARGADLVLLDEPTNNMDPRHELLLTEILSTPDPGPDQHRAVLLVSHERVFLEGACTRVLEIGAWV